MSGLFFIETGFKLSLPDSEHLGATYWACAPNCRLAVLHGDAFGIIHLPLRSALNAITLHRIYLLFSFRHNDEVITFTQYKSIDRGHEENTPYRLTARDSPIFNLFFQ